MGLTNRLRRLGTRARLAWRAWRAIPAQPSEGLSEVEDSELDSLFPEDEVTARRAEIVEDLEHGLETDFNALIHSIRGGNGDKKA